MNCPFSRWAIKSEAGLYFIKNDIELKQAQSRGEKLIPIPCGKCMACRIAKSKEIIKRLSLEAQHWKYEHCYFVTLTYNTDNLKPPTHKSNGRLVKQHLIKFIKRTRRIWYEMEGHTGIKFYAVGEYGEKNYRPHYHVIFFNLPMHLEATPAHKHFNNSMLSQIWGRGYIDIEYLCEGNIKYIAQYVTKKLTKEKLKEEKKVCPEFSYCSMNLGNYFNNKKELMKKIYLNKKYVWAPKNILKNNLDKKELNLIQEKINNEMSGQTQEQKIEIYKSKIKKINEKNLLRKNRI